jgi:hypothetical protein
VWHGLVCGVRGLGLVRGLLRVVALPLDIPEC